VTRWLESGRLGAAAAVVLALLLSALAFLQHRWLADVSTADRQRIRHAMQAAAEGLTSELGRELRRALLAFHAPHAGRAGHEERLAERLASWRASAAFPELIQEVFVATVREEAFTELERLDPATGAFVPAAWPDDLGPLECHHWRHEPGPPPPFHLIAEPALALVFPLAWPGATSLDRTHAAIILRLDRQHFIDVIVPRLVARWFDLASRDLLVLALAPSGPAYLSDPSLPLTRYLPGEVALPFFRPEPFPVDVRAPTPAGTHALERSWRLVVSHRAGSLQAVVDRARHRQIAISGGVLVLLAASIVVMAVAAQRAQRLLRQQMTFVAGVTHELNTPLAAIRSAAQNLADGVVADAPHVRRYGALIEREGSRLSSLVAKALEMAGIQSGRARVYHPEPTALAKIVDEALATSRFSLDEKRFEVTRTLPEDLPLVLVDPRGVRLALQNLIENALEHAAEGRWIGVRAEGTSDGRWVTLVVEDRGPGVHPEDEPRVFEFFYRGRSRQRAPVPGSGIGLGLVREVIEKHGGRVKVGPGPGGCGAAFEMRLPAAGSRHRCSHEA
jgi:signal transduction histidine kinase